MFFKCGYGMRITACALAFVLMPLSMAVASDETRPNPPRPDDGPYVQKLRQDPTVRTEWLATLRHRVKTKISQPSQSLEDLPVSFLIKLSTTGEVLEVSQEGSTQSTDLDGAIKRAIFESSPFPPNLLNMFEPFIKLDFRLKRESFSRPDKCDFRFGPRYPRRSILNKESGVSVVSLLISREGEVTDFRLVKSSGFWRLDLAALQFLPQCLFKERSIENAAYTWAIMNYHWKMD